MFVLLNTTSILQASEKAKLTKLINKWSGTANKLQKSHRLLEKPRENLQFLSIKCIFRCEKSTWNNNMINQKLTV